MADNMTGIKIKALPEAKTISGDMDIIVEDTAPKTWRTKLSQLVKKIIGEKDISKIGDGTCTGAIDALNNGLSKTNEDLSTCTRAIDTLEDSLAEINIGLSFSDWIDCGSAVGGTIKCAYRYSKRLVEFKYWGQLQAGRFIDTTGLQFFDIPSNLKPTSVCTYPIYCPSNGNKLCIRMNPGEKNAWHIASTISCTTISEYICGHFMYCI